MRKLHLIGLAALLGLVLSGCGGASGIQEGVPQDVQGPPPDFDPGGDEVPQM